MLNLELPKSLRGIQQQAQQVARHMFRPISRKYDLAEHTRPRELDTFAALMNGMNQGMGDAVGTGSLSKGGPAGGPTKPASEGVRNGANMSTVLGILELAWGDIGFALSIPGQGLGNAAIDAVATPEQRARFKGKWAAMAITEPGAGSDSAAIRTTARLQGEQWVIEGEKIYVTAGERCDVVVVWATLDPAMGRSAIKSFVVETGNPGMQVTRLEKKLGIKSSDTAAISFTDCRIPRDNILGSEEVKARKGFAGVMQTFDNTRPMVAALSVGVARASLEVTRELLEKQGIDCAYRGGLWTRSAVEAELYRMEADMEAARLLVLKAAWMADNKQPNSLEASMSKAKAGRMGNQVTLRCSELCGSLGYSESSLLEKWARDSKILDIFEGTQQIQQLIIARRLLGKNSSELR